MKKFCVGLLLCCVLIFAAPFTACSDNQSETPITPPTIEAPDEPFFDELFDVAGTAQTSDGLQYQKFISRNKKIKKAYITGYNGSNFNVQIPQIIDGYTVTEISGSAFKGTEINSVTLPDCVEKIAGQAFRNCRFLTSVDLGSVQAIGDSAFRNCPILTSVVLPETCNYWGESVFSECVSLSTVNIPSKIKELPEFAFNYCESLENIVIPKTINKIGKSAFYYCTALKKIEIPTSVTEMGGSVFEGCESLKTANVNASWRKIPERTFYKCKSLESIFIPEGIAFIENNAFYNCLGLKAVTMPSTLQAIYNSAFYGCDNLEEVNLNEGLTTIYANAFGSNYTAVSPGVMERHLTSIVIPSTVLKIEKAAFCLGRSYVNADGDISFIWDYSFGADWTYIPAKAYCRSFSKPTAWASDWINCNEDDVIWGYSD